MKLFKSLTLSSTVLGIAMLCGGTAFADNLKAKSVVLVHGAFADGSSWSKVAPILEKAGLNVIAVQNPLDSLAGDAAYTKRAIKRAEGPVVLVGHSWGGMVITEAGDHEKVQSLVYVAALAPQLGQSLGEASKMDVYPTAGVGAIKPDADGYLYLPKEAVAKYFAPDLSAEDTAFMAASQGMLNSQAMGQKTTKAAWKSKPSFYAIAGDDQMIPTKLQREFAESIGATTEEIKSSHAIMLSNPDFVASLIIKAAK